MYNDVHTITIILLLLLLLLLLLIIIIIIMGSGLFWRGSDGHAAVN